MNTVQAEVMLNILVVDTDGTVQQIEVPAESIVVFKDAPDLDTPLLPRG